MDWKGALVVTGLFHGFACCTARLALAATVLLFYCLSTKAIDEEDESAQCTDAHKTNSDVGIINHQAGFGVLGVVPKRPKTPKHPPTTHLPHVPHRGRPHVLCGHNRYFVFYRARRCI